MQNDQFKQYEKLTQEREKFLAEGNIPECFTDFYLEEVARRGEDVGTFTRRQMYFFQGDMFGAGTETSVNTIMFVILFLASEQYQDVQKKIQKKIDLECGYNPPTLKTSIPLLRAAILGISTEINKDRGRG